MHEPRDAPAHRRLERVERAHEVVVEDGVRRVLRRLGDRRGVDDGVVAADERVGVAGVGEIGLDVADLAALGLVERAVQVGRGDLVAGVVQGRDRGGADLPAGAGDEDAHGRRSSRSACAATLRCGGCGWFRSGFPAERVGA